MGYDGFAAFCHADRFLYIIIDNTFRSRGLWCHQFPSVLPRRLCPYFIIASSSCSCGLWWHQCPGILIRWSFPYFIIALPVHLDYDDISFPTFPRMWSEALNLWHSLNYIFGLGNSLVIYNFAEAIFFLNGKVLKLRSRVSEGKLDRRYNFLSI